jgi:hypothetical protein
MEVEKKKKFSPSFRPEFVEEELGRDLAGPFGLCNINSLWNYTITRA